MKVRAILLAGCLTGLTGPVPALGQDVVVMRRVVAPPQRASVQPAPTPTPAPAPAPTPTPTPSPSPTIQPGSWQVGDWTFVDGDVCNEAARQTRTVTCTAGSVAVDPSRCVGPQPSVERTVARMEGCTFAWRQGTYGPYDSTCSDAAHRAVLTPTVCIRVDGAVVAEELCGAVTRPDDALIAPRYEGCTIDWVVGSYGDWSSTCSTAATRTRSVQCVRYGGDAAPAQQPDASCQQARPDATTAPTEVSTGCSFTPTYSTSFGSCSPSSPGSTVGTQMASLAKCMRSDGVDATVANANSGYANCAASTTRSCSVSYVGTYTWGTCLPSAQGATAGSQAGTIASCQTSDGSAAPIGACAATSSRACTVESYSQTYGGYGTCSGGSQSAPIATCKTRAVTGEVGTVANGLCPANTQSLTRSCTASSCGSFNNNRWVLNGGVVPNGRIFVTNTTVADALVSARSHCQSLPGVAQCELSWDPDNVRGRMTITAYGSGTQGFPNNGYSYQSAVCTGG